MDSSTLIITLAIVTLVLVLAYAAWQRAKVSKAKDTHEHSALTAGHPEQRSTHGAPGVPAQK